MRHVDVIYLQIFIYAAGIAEFETQKSLTGNKQATQLRISLFFSTAAIQAVTCYGYIPYITYCTSPIL